MDSLTKKALIIEYFKCFCISSPDLMAKILYDLFTTDEEIQKKGVEIWTRYI